MYAIGGRGVQGCAPIPGAGGGVSQQSPSPPPRPLGEWIRTWGGVAVSPTTSDAGVSTGQLSKKAAERDAMAKCAVGRLCSAPRVWLKEFVRTINRVPAKPSIATARSLCLKSIEVPERAVSLAGRREIILVGIERAASWKALLAHICHVILARAARAIALRDGRNAGHSSSAVVVCVERLG
ncbi:DUF4189 domain-containing protein [Stenotrophomonas indicatrix]|uniref:DUF4189 domain-containing protein n=1 Tax=Stenotrophomonas indicatrix TaxID=2045451 RepID=UPI0028A0E5A3|nr:DUF4189 domain-containing protein [Stenotrophomonas indicatrix]